MRIKKKNYKRGKSKNMMTIWYKKKEGKDKSLIIRACIGLMQKYPPIFKKMFLNDVALLWMRGFHAYDTASVS